MLKILFIISLPFVLVFLLDGFVKAKLEKQKLLASKQIENDINTNPTASNIKEKNLIKRTVIYDENGLLKNEVVYEETILDDNEHAQLKEALR